MSIKIMRKVPFQRNLFFANYFWSVKDGTEIREDVLAKTYLSNYFTFKDIVGLYLLIGRDRLLKYANELQLKDRIEKLIDKIEMYKRKNI